MSDKSGNKNISAAALFWAVFIIVIISMFGIFSSKIYEVFVTTDFFNVVFGEEPAFLHDKLDNARLRIHEKVLSKEVSPAEANGRIETGFSKITEQIKTEVSDVSKVLTSETSAPPVQDKKKMNAAVFFVHIDGNGTVIRKETERITASSAAPLKTAIEMLLEGPTPEESEKGIVTLIPQGTKLISASINNKVASLNFSEEFLYNKFGVEGYIGQLMQIVYTSTSFQSIDSVQFLVEGHMKEFLGNESVWVGSPLARSTFK